MKKEVYKTVTGMVLILALLSCEKKNNVIPSSNITSEFRDITGYDKLEVNDAFEVEVNYSETSQPIEIIANDNLHEYIEVVKNADVLRVGLQNSISISGNAKIKVVLTTDYLTGYTVNGASLISLKDTIRANQVAINLTGASKMDGTMIIQNLSVDMREASFLDITGETTDLNLTASGASRMSGYAFGCLDLDADLSGASEAELTVNGKININASGASILRYRGNATIESQHLTGASTITKTD